MDAVFFDSPADFRKWLEQNHDKESELFVGFYKKGTGKQTMNWSDSVDQALCFGWIDGRMRPIDNEKYCLRFTPRRKGSTWSVVNIKKVEKLLAQGLMHPSGIAKFKERTEAKSGIYAHENKTTELSEDYRKHFQANKKAWDFFTSQAPSYQRTLIHLVMSAKQEKTRISRLTKLIADSEAGKRLERFT
ncbi:MAG TPA: YdeI/OmpD-associated family protein [Flavobacterium sp.]|jgi:uncharacterized protein YdeI (YjbR/CyaY-like superfamily)